LNEKLPKIRLSLKSNNIIMPRISIIIPCYNAEKYIHQCLESIYRQGLRENSFEVIIVNDGSKDKSIENIRDLTEKHQNLKIINQANQGVSTARNNGLKAAQGTYIWFVDADDLLVDNCLSQILDIAEKYTIDILKIQYVRTDDPDILEKIKRTSVPHYKPNLTCKSGTDEFIENFIPIQGNTWQYIFLKKFLFKNHLKYLEHISIAEDFLFSMSALLSAKKVMNIPITTYIYRQHESSTMHTISKENLQSLTAVIEQVYLLSKKQSNILLKEKMRFCIFRQLSILFWYLVHVPTLYHQRKEIIAGIKKKIPFFMQKNSFHEFIFSLFYNSFPSFYVWLRHLFISIL